MLPRRDEAPVMPQAVASVVEPWRRTATHGDAAVRRVCAVAAILEPTPVWHRRRLPSGV